MHLKTNEPVVFNVEQIITSVDIDHIDFYSHYMAVKLAARHYRSAGYDVFSGSDFENNMTLFLNNAVKKRSMDDYTKIKIGRSHLSADVTAYCESLMKYVPPESIDTLLYICRLCSYTGGPGFPDMIIAKAGVQESTKPSFKMLYVLFDELQANQKMFMVISKIMGIDTAVVEVSAAKEEKSLSILPHSVIGDILSDSRSISVVDGIDEAIESEKKKLALALSTAELAQVEDEITWLAGEKMSKPFHMMRSWISQGIISAEDLHENMGAIGKIHAVANEEFEKYEKELLDDREFLSVMAGKSEESMKRKAGLMQKKFFIGPSKAKALLRFVEAGYS